MTEPSQGTSRARVYHPLLAAAFPVLFLYADNLKEGVTLRDLVLPLLITLVGAALLFVVATKLLGSAMKAGLLVSGWALLFFSYGHVWLLFQGTRVGGFLVGRHLFLILAWTGLGIGVLVLALRAGRWLPGTTRALNVVLGALVLFNVGSIALDSLRPRGAADRVAAAEAATQPVRPDPDARDIYYVILDRYAAQPTLQKYYGFDNSPFLDALEERGFFVPDAAWGNYPRSTHSMASSLNMTHLQFLKGEAGGDPRPLAELYDAPEAARFLKGRGYRYVNVGNWWSVTRVDPYADENIQFDAPSRFSSVLVDTTMMAPFADRLGWFKKLRFRRTEFRRIKFQFGALEGVAKDPRPTFTFAHFLFPHEPFIFDRDGSYVNGRESGSRSRKQNYLNQLQYANTRILELFDRLLAVPESQRPIIILQSDEGPEPIDTDDRLTAWGQASLPQLEQKLRILNAYHFPGLGQNGLYETITPVNSFRVLFNDYFRAGLPLLPDRTFIYLRGLDQYNFRDETERLRALDN